MDEYYWELILKDGEVIEVSPRSVPVIQQRMSNRDVVRFRTRSIPFSEIKDFRQTTKPFGVNLLVEAAQAFHEPQLNEDGSIVARWVKKKVTVREYQKHYNAIPAYRNLGSEGNMVVVAFRKPVHEINIHLTPYCTSDEVQLLTKR
jgi:hypothetical protein